MGHNNPKRTENFLVVFSFLMFFLGLYLGREIWFVDKNKRIADIVSCVGYEEDFLKKMGFKDRADCANLNLSLHRKYTDTCSNEVDTNQQELVDACVYHLLEARSTSLSAEHTAHTPSPKTR